MRTITSATAAHVRELLGTHRITQTEAGRILGLPQSAVSARLTGHRAFQLDELDTLAKHFDLDVRDLIAVPA